MQIPALDSLLKFWLLSLALILAAQSAFAQMQTASFDLPPDDPDGAVKTLETLYGDEARISRHGDRVLVRAEASLIEELGKTMQQLSSTPRRLLLRVATGSRPGGSVRRYTTGPDPMAITVLEGHTAVLSRMQTERRLEGAGWGWLETETVPVAGRWLKLTPESDGQNVRVTVDWRGLDGDDRRAIVTTISGAAGEWLPLTPSASATSEGARVWSTGDDEQLWLRVELAP